MAQTTWASCLWVGAWLGAEQDVLPERWYADGAGSDGHWRGSEKKACSLGAEQGDAFMGAEGWGG